VSASRIGRLRRRLTLERPVDAPDGQGGVNRVWEEAAVVWGALEPIQGEESYTAGRIAGRSRVRLTIRFRPDVTTAWRAREQERIFNFANVFDPDGRRNRLQIEAEEDRA